MIQPRNILLEVFTPLERVDPRRPEQMVRIEPTVEPRAGTGLEDGGFSPRPDDESSLDPETEGIRSLSGM